MPAGGPRLITFVAFFIPAGCIRRQQNESWVIVASGSEATITNFELVLALYQHFRHFLTFVYQFVEDDHASQQVTYYWAQSPTSELWGDVQGTLPGGEVPLLILFF